MFHQHHVDPATLIDNDPNPNPDRDTVLRRASNDRDGHRLNLLLALFALATLACAWIAR